LDPLWETTLGIQQLTTAARSPAEFRTVRRRARALVEEKDLQGLVRVLAMLVPNTGYYPDFLTPPEAADGLAAGLDAIRGTPRQRVREEVRRLAESATPAGAGVPWLRDLVRGDHDRMADLTGALRAVHGVLTASAAPEAEALVEADRDRRATAQREGGVHRLLGSLAPDIRWQPPVLHVNYPVDRDVHLSGRGLRLVPSYFCWRMPIALADPELEPVLVYPVHRRDLSTPPKSIPHSLVSLLGRTRAQVLAAVRDTATTGELANRLRVSPASASEHVHVLAAAKLVRSHRMGNQVLHTVTPLGAALLNGRQPADALSN
jgi:DNA-binding transcriptional ArsR family regulator